MDRYSKVVLTVIAAALVALVVQNATTRALALTECGSRYDPCYVDSVGLSGMTVNIAR